MSNLEIPTDERTMQRFWKYVALPTEPDACMIWIGGKNSDGYGQFQAGSHTDGTARKVPAHRVAYTALVGAIPPGMNVDHICANPACVRPDHLRLASHAENMRYRRKHRNNTSGFRGVSFDRTNAKWHAQICVAGRRTSVGRYRTAEDAARAYDDAARKYHGKFARLNFPGPGEAAAHVPPNDARAFHEAQIAKIL